MVNCGEDFTLSSTTAVRVRHAVRDSDFAAPWTKMSKL